MTEIELDRICENNPDCGCECMKCAIFGYYMKHKED